MIIFNSSYCQEEYLKLSMKTRMVKTKETGASLIGAELWIQR